ncbi:UPF0545 protein C22orf39 homolog isoform X2 [Varanus komodoensis]|uniref:UPF0545 protein C22orf39 homolog isoform X2 n=1 Tax=Varanus komodoensis TaxID=61221 RepID=UPI001CF7C5AC|nr:UPF0545 protein C22orf39 homolog isoform X2 [Varanus komodoensis]
MADRETWRPPRVCEDYWAEWKHCRSIQNVFHNYYTYGKAPSCAQWKRDYQDCREWEKTRNAAAKDSLCSSERKRVEEKQKHAPVWEFRKKPPLDWHLPLNEEKPK